MSYHTDPRLMAEMVLPLLCHFFFYSREPTNLRFHSRGILGISRPCIQGTSHFDIHWVCVREGERERDTCFWTNLSLNVLPAVIKSFTSQLLRFNLWSIYQYVRLCVSMRCCSHFKRPRLCLSVFGKKNVCSLSSPPLSQHVGLCVCEDSSCILRSRSRGKHLPLSPRSPSSSSSCPHLTLMAVGFLMRKWVSLCSVSVEGLQRGGLKGGGGRRDVLVQNTSPGCEAQTPA